MMSMSSDCSSDESWSPLSSSSSITSSSGGFSDGDESLADWNVVLPRHSKREYLLAQIRQKNAIIESLLKQVSSRPPPLHPFDFPSPALRRRRRNAPGVAHPRSSIHFQTRVFTHVPASQIHNPYLATPMSIASYRMATSPTDQNNQNVLAWLDRLQASVQAAGTTGGLSAFKMDARADGPSDDSEEDGADGAGGEPTERGSVGQPEDDEPLKDAEDRPTALPNEAVPIGLLANLALDNKSKRKKKANAKPKDNESSDDDVVSCRCASVELKGGVDEERCLLAIGRRVRDVLRPWPCFQPRASRDDDRERQPARDPGPWACHAGRRREALQNVRTMPVFRINLNQRELKSSAAISRKSTPIATSSTQFYTLPPRRSRAAPSSSQSVSKFYP